MPLRLDIAPSTVSKVVNDGIRQRMLSQNGQAMPTAKVTPAVAHRYVAVRRRPGPLLGLMRDRSWDHFVLQGEEVYLATVRQDGDNVFFERLSQGPVARSMLAGLSLLTKAVDSCREYLYVRVFECRPARLLSVVAQRGSGASFYVKVIDNRLIDPAEMRVCPNVDDLRRLIAERLAALPKQTFLSIRPP